MEPIVPMEPQITDSIPHGDNWIHQVKWDGVRVLTYVDGKEIRLFNRKIRERTLHYPELTSMSFATSKSLILDGEIIALGPDGKPSFHEVMSRDGIRIMSKVDQMRTVVPITYMVFDVLYRNGEWLNGRPWMERNEILNEVVTPTPNIQLVESHDDGESLFQVIKQHGMEGIVSKRKDSLYLMGEKKDFWLKKKNYRDLIAAIGGFTQNGGIVNSVLVGLYDEAGKFWYIGHTGTGKMSQKDWRDLTERLRPLVVEEKPFVNKTEREQEAIWVRPEFTTKIQFAEWTEGRVLRQPSIQAFVDIPAHDCVFDPEMRT